MKEIFFNNIGLTCNFAELIQCTELARKCQDIYGTFDKKARRRLSEGVDSFGGPQDTGARSQSANPKVPRSRHESADKETVSKKCEYCDGLDGGGVGTAGLG